MFARLKTITHSGKDNSLHWLRFETTLTQYAVATAVYRSFKLLPVILRLAIPIAADQAGQETIEI